MSGWIYLMSGWQKGRQELGIRSIAVINIYLLVVTQQDCIQHSHETNLVSTCEQLHVTLEHMGTKLSYSLCMVVGVIFASQQKSQGDIDDPPE